MCHTMLSSNTSCKFNVYIQYLAPSSANTIVVLISLYIVLTLYDMDNVFSSKGAGTTINFTTETETGKKRHNKIGLTEGVVVGGTCPVFKRSQTY